MNGYIWGGYQFGIDNVCFFINTREYDSIGVVLPIFFEILWLVTAYGGGHYQNNSYLKKK
jgi:hypothetical protein